MSDTEQTSCLTEHFFDRAVARAVYLDEFLGREGKPLGPLHGLPISIKDSFCVQGVQSTLGYVSFLGNPPAEANSALVKMLLDLGAVLYVKTNIPQTLMVSAFFFFSHVSRVQRQSAVGDQSDLSMNQPVMLTCTQTKRRRRIRKTTSSGAR